MDHYVEHWPLHRSTGNYYVQTPTGAWRNRWFRTYAQAQLRADQLNRRATS